MRTGIPQITETLNARRELGSLARTYVREIDRLSYTDLCGRQEAPWASIAFGAAGVAYMLWRLSGRRRDRLPQAQRWLAEASGGSRRRAAFYSPSFEGLQPNGLHYSADGIHYIQELIGKSDAQARSAFLKRCLRSRLGPAEFLLGSAGYLNGLMILYRRTGDSELLATAGILAQDLIERVTGKRNWARDSNLGFAHGRAGTFHALLTWSLLTHQTLPDFVFAELDDLAEALNESGLVGRRRLRGDPDLRASWCNGAAGFALLWVRAYEHTRKPRYLRLARQASRHVWDGAPVNANLCCGLGGRAYALLAMERIAPDEGWEDRALRLAVGAAELFLKASGPWPNGLYKGFPGLVCLVKDLSTPPNQRIGFPMVEG